MRPFNTLFLLQSVDGKISTGYPDTLDVDEDYPRIDNLKHIYNEYLKIEQTTDLWSLNSGRVLNKVGINQIQDVTYIGVNFIIIDDDFINGIGIKNLLAKADKIIFITRNKNHISTIIKNERIHTIFYNNLEQDISKIMKQLRKEYKISKITIQTGGTLNRIWCKAKIIDRVLLVIAPVIIGGKNTPSLVDGEDNMTFNDFKNNSLFLKLKECEKIGSGLKLVYDVN